MPNLLVILIFLPAAAAAMLLLLDPKAPAIRARWAALLATLATFLVSLGVASQFFAVPRVADAAQGPVHPHLQLKHAWMTLVPASGDIGGISLEFFLGLDGISLAMVLLTTLLTISAVLVSWTAITDRPAEFYASLLILESGLIGVFCAFDLTLFYVFFEFTLIPLFFMVGIWGGPLRRYAAGKFFIYTLAGSVITLLGLIWLVIEAYHVGLKTETPLSSPFSIPEIARVLQPSMGGLANGISAEAQAAIFLMIAAGFMVKVPLFPFHTWLPLAHVEAPTAGSVLLAGVLLKLGTYGFLRLCLPMLPIACLQVGLPLVGVMSVIGIVYGSFCALAQNDIKKLVAYSSVAHLGFCMLGLFALNSEGISGGVLQMINHGLSTGALFCIVGMFYERYHTRQLTELGGLANRMPLMAVAMVFTSFASIGLPGLNGFVGEVLSLMGMFKRDPLLAMIGASGVVLGAWYLLGVLQKAFFGPLQEPHHGHEPVADLNAREMLALAPLMAMCLWLGLFPQPVLDLIRPDVESVTALYDEVRAVKVPKSVAQTPVEARPAIQLAAAETEVELDLPLQNLAAPEAQKSESRP
jgi:NADH-quinone oxidoreductase subunit M